MIDREKVIKGLTCCSNHTPGFGCNVCPYECDDMDQCIEAVTYDALSLLKEQEPRVLTLEEVIKHYSLPPAFPDDLAMQEDYYEDIQPLYFEFPHDNEDSWIVHWRGHSHVARYLDEWKNTYGITWRVWSAKPTDEQRKAVAWND